jgi:hypothetical protein
MMPSIKTLCASFPITKDDAKLIRTLYTVSVFPLKLENIIMEGDFPTTQAWARSCYNNPFGSQHWRDTMALSAISEIIGGYGIESLHHKSQTDMEQPRYQYVNKGDTYAKTLIVDCDKDRLFVGCWGDLPFHRS